ncbi:MULTISPECIES: (2Fe-2S)-binding protein [Roseomonadaceae]|uniref:(2Fe-2S)-binding protein n=1 Tax=Falsiroseomonas oleicola TaxID=2801474 RepID=A0ABS6H0Z5_9PROT|nr:(2Fe-2S)-binding protein [Roseomonas oleicola]MBU8542342.1 (2Fe-2S)-binding protein [Roseomonas oleicola]
MASTRRVAEAPPGSIAFNLNGVAVAAPIEGEAPLLAALRGPLGLSGTRFGCGAEQCGACLVLVDDQPSYACTLPVGSVAGRRVTTVEGLGSAAAPHPVQRALLDMQAGQCGYCLSGIQIRAVALLRETPRPDEAAVRAALDPHLCRCGSHNRIVAAILQAAAEMAP